MGSIIQTFANGRTRFHHYFIDNGYETTLAELVMKDVRRILKHRSYIDELDLRGLGFKYRVKNNETPDVVPILVNGGYVVQNGRTGGGDAKYILPTNGN